MRYPVSGIIENIAYWIEQNVLPHEHIVYGSDPPINGICLIQNGGYAPDIHLNKGMIYSMPVLLNGKNEDQEKLIDYLWSIHEALTKRKRYAWLSNEDIQIISIETTSAPMIIGREQNRQWVAGSSFEVRYYWR